MLGTNRAFIVPAWHGIRIVRSPTADVVPAWVTVWLGGNKQFSERKVYHMSRMLTLAVALGAMTLGFTGCAEKASTTTEKTVSTPQGETTTTTEKTVEQSGENPPPAN